MHMLASRKTHVETSSNLIVFKEPIHFLVWIQCFETIMCSKITVMDLENELDMLEYIQIACYVIVTSWQKET